MPKLSERQCLLNDIEQAMKLAAFDAAIRDPDEDTDLDAMLWPDTDGLFSLMEDEHETIFETLGSLHLLICQQRFLNGRQVHPKSRDFVLNYFQNQPDPEFRKITRVTRETFRHIVSLIEWDPVFHNVSTCPQAPVHWQLACALDRLGNDGNGVSHARSKLIWGIGQGTMHLYTRRVVQALWRLRDLYIRWPSEQERSQISRRLEGKGFKGEVGFVDGTCIPLHKKPAIFGNVFMDRKKRYSVNAQVVCDDRRRITFFMTGRPGSSGDSHVFSHCIIARRPDLAFSPGQYLLADSAYGTSTTIIPSYKENQHDDRNEKSEPRKIEFFNNYLAKARVVNEHTIGVLRSRWQSLRGARIDIHKPEDMKTFVRQVVACVVLHNLCLDDDPWEEEFEEENGDEEEEVVPTRGVGRALTPGQRKRWEVRRSCLSFHGVE